MGSRVEVRNSNVEIRNLEPNKGCVMRDAVAENPRSRVSRIPDHASRVKPGRDHNFFSSFLTSAFTFSQKDSFGAFLHPSIRTGTIFSIPATLTPALSGLPPWP